MSLHIHTPKLPLTLTCTDRHTALACTAFHTHQYTAKVHTDTHIDTDPLTETHTHTVADLKKKQTVNTCLYTHTP